MISFWTRVRTPTTVAVLVAGAFLLPFLLTSQQQSLATRALIFGMAAASLDIAYGQAGLYSLGNAALFGVGGYTVGILMVRYGVESFWVLIAAAIAGAAIASLVFGLIALRARGLYFILVTLALGQMVANIVQQWGFLKTSYSESVTGIYLPTLGLGEQWTNGTFYQFVLVIAAVMLFAIRRIATSPIGSAIRGTRENEVRMAVLGYNVWRIRLLALVLSGTFTGVSGALFAFQSGLIAPTNIGVAASGILVLMVIIGGSGTRYGAFIGGIIVTLLTYYASQWNEQRAPMIIGVIFVVTALLNRYRAKAGAAMRGIRRKEVSDAAA
jgi:branched-chain amino acid transport system permease protein